ncbi:DNA cross-link repair protein SNM1 isoform X1 [Beta vulgaris subsp. vulgaris]|uniref:DNA cross-link repair protein SNM1 isoform X1 n=1 Tax=Beta vulgaris subsp. vulgaris TaxID=3555 RepID=UPI002036DF05|nr:DNA cross-link repair protein SNM1 isoform X1 [Beta vulgaris subsp. vulgaris]
MIGKKRRCVSLSSINDDNYAKSSVPTTINSTRPHSSLGKENIPPSSTTNKDTGEFEAFYRTQSDSYPSFGIQIDANLIYGETSSSTPWVDSCFSTSLDELDSEILENSAYTCRSPCERRNLDHCSVRGGHGLDIDGNDAEDEDDFESNTQFGVLMRLCYEEDDNSSHEPGPALVCPMCGIDISLWDEESRQSHANACLDNLVAPKGDSPGGAKNETLQSSDKPSVQSSEPASAEAAVIKWLHSLGLAKYEAAFVEQEIDWESLQWLTEEDLIAIGINALGPRKKILESLRQLRNKDNISEEQGNRDSVYAGNEAKKPAMNKLITEYFSSPSGVKKNLASSRQQTTTAKSNSCQRIPAKSFSNGKNKDVPLWCSIPGTPFRVDAFRYLRRDCSHWFLTHFHIDHYQGLTRSFAYGKVYCSMITAKLVNAKIGIPWEKLQVMPLNQKINVAGIDVTCYDANHCPGSVIILFEPPNGKAVLHTGDFRFNEEMANTLSQLGGHINALILDTTYCSPQYNFPKQEVVVQFVIEAIQAESFNSKTLFLIGSYTVGKERIFIEVARVLRKKIHVPAAKLRLLECLELPSEDMQWFTLNEHESNIHIVPMWTIASFKRLKQLSSQYAERFSLIVAFSPTGWAFGKGKKNAGRAGRRWQQGTIIRYEVPYSEHCSFEELREFVKLISPTKIIPSVNNDSEASSNAMIELLLS